MDEPWHQKLERSTPKHILGRHNERFCEIQLSAILTANPVSIFFTSHRWSKLIHHLAMCHASLPTFPCKVTIELPTLWQTNLAMENCHLQSLTVLTVHLSIQKGDLLQPSEFTRGYTLYWWKRYNTWSFFSATTASPVLVFWSLPLNKNKSRGISWDTLSNHRWQTHQQYSTISLKYRHSHLHSHQST